MSGQQAERGVEVIVGSLHTEGPLVRGDLRDRLDAEGIPTGGQALVHLLAAASLHGLIVRGPVLETGHAFVSVDDWLGKPPPTLERQEALGRLAMRYLEGHQPAAPGDLAKWAGITLSDARLGFSELADEIRSLGEGFVLRGKRLGRSKSPPTRLLGPFDPLLHGWASREMWVGAHLSVVTTNGIFRAVVLSDGRVTGTWRRSPDGVLVEPLEAIDEGATAALLEDAQDLFRFMRWKARSSVISVHSLRLADVSSPVGIRMVQTPTPSASWAESAGRPACSPVAQIGHAPIASSVEADMRLAHVLRSMHPSSA